MTNLVLQSYKWIQIQKEGDDHENMVNDFEIDSAEILDEMTTRRGELKLRSSFNDRQYHAGSEIPNQMVT